MGSSDSKAKNLKMDMDEWEKVEEQATFDIMRNKKTGMIGELYHFVIPDNRQIDEEVKKYAYRNNTTDNVVRVHGIEVEEKGFGFCGSQQMASILTERIPTRLNESRPLNRDEEAIVLYNSLKGFDNLYHRYGPVDVNAQMIGFNQVGQTKVWMNRNYGMNYASEGRKTHFEDHEGSEQALMINNIVEVVEEKSNGRRIAEPLRSEVTRRTSLADAAEVVVRNSNIRPDFLLQNQLNIGPEQVVFNNQPDKDAIQPVFSSQPQTIYQTSQPPVHPPQPVFSQPQYVQQPLYTEQPPVVSVPVSTRVSQPVVSQVPQQVPQVPQQVPQVPQQVPQVPQQVQVENRAMDSMAYQPVSYKVSEGGISGTQPRAVSSKFSFSYQGNSLR